MNRDRVDAVVKIFAEVAARDFLIELAIGRRDQTNINFDRIFSADAEDFTFLNEAKKFRLDTGAQFTDFVQEESSAVCGFSETDFTSVSARERAFLVTEEF